MPEREPRQSLNYGRTIEALRRERGMTHEALAAASGVSASYLSEVERGLKRPSTDVLAKLAKAFDMLPSRLLEYVEAQTLASPAASTRIEPSRVFREESGIGSSFDRPKSIAPRGAMSQRVSSLVALAEQLSDEDLRMLLELARYLLEKSAKR